MESLGVYVINLQSRPDRLESISAALKSRGMAFDRIEACTPGPEKSEFLALGVLATFNSHVKALKTFLDSGKEFALILEDDAEFIERFSLVSVIEHLNNDIGFIQLGFLKSNLVDNFEVFYFNLRRTFICRTFQIIEKLVPKFVEVLNLKSRLVISEHSFVPDSWIASNIQAGGHAYIVNRTFASGIIQIGEKPFLAIDDLYMALGRMRTFSMYRLKSSQVGQGNFGNDVANRFKMEEKG